MAAPQLLITSWRERATYLEQFGDSNTARLWKIAAGELERALQSVDDEALTLTEAAEQSGYSIEHLASLIRRGKLPNAGRPNAPRIHRKDIPTKRSRGPGRPARRRLSITTKREVPQ